MLFRKLITTYGASLAGHAAPHDDPVWYHGHGDEDLRSFREYALKALLQAKVYLLDHAAAAYTDTLREAILEKTENKDAAALTLLGEVSPPADVAWVEYDAFKLEAGCVPRNSPSIQHRGKPSGSELRGYLIDNRDTEALRVTVLTSANGTILDPYYTLLFKRSEQSGRGLTHYQPHPHSYMLKVLRASGFTDEKIEGRSQRWLESARNDLFIPYALFAMLVSPDLGGIIPTETVLFSPKEMKTARKFGKLWIAGAPKSHLTIRIGPQAAAHMQERVARLEFEEQAREDRNSPIRHWVSEHERHYRSGRVVLVKGHHRGQEAKSDLPTRVMGPRSKAFEFELPPDD